MRDFESVFWAILGGVVLGVFLGIMLAVTRECVTVVHESQNTLHASYKGAVYVLIPAKVTVEAER